MPESQQPHVYLTSTVLFGLALLPACLIALLIWEYSVDVPQWDQWELVSLFEKFAKRTLSLSDLFAQQNEYRQFFPNLLFVGLGSLTKWDVRYEMVFSFLLACLISFNVFKLSGLTIAGGLRQRLWLFLAANLLIFSASQNENWLQGQQVIYFVPVACITTGILIAYSTRFDLAVKFLFCAALSVVSTFSSANGLLSWVVLAPVLAWCSPQGSSDRKEWLGFGWLIGFGLSLALYFYDFKHSPGPFQQVEVLPTLGRAGLFFLSLLGAPFALGKLAIAVATGVVLLTLFVWMSRLFLRSWSAPDVRRSMLPWLMLGVYSMMTAVLVTFGRLRFGSALETRYTTFTVYLAVAMVYLIPITLSANQSPAGRYTKYLRLAKVAPVLAAVLLLAQLPNYFKEVRYANVLRLTLLQGKACILYGNVVREECSNPLYPLKDPMKDASLQTRANVLDQLGFMRPALVRNAELSESGLTPADYGSFLQLEKVRTDEYVASGWAMLPFRGEPPAVVLLAYEDADNKTSVFAMAMLETQRDFVSAIERRGVYGDNRWRKSFSARALPSPAKLSAWALDAYTGRVFRIAGTHVLKEADRGGAHL